MYYPVFLCYQANKLKTQYCYVISTVAKINISFMNRLLNVANIHYFFGLYFKPIKPQQATK